MSETTTPPADGAEPPTQPTVPRAVNLAAAAVCAQVLFVLLRAGSFFGFSDALQRLLIKSNNDLKTTDKHRKDPHTYVLHSQQVVHDLHSWRQNSLLNAIVIAVALLFLAWSLRRVSMASITRWALIVVMFLTGGPLDALQLSTGLPGAIKVLYALSAVSALAAIVLLFTSESRAYFHAVSEARRQQFASRYGPRPATQRPSLRTMFAPRPPVQSDAPQPAASSPAKPAASGGKAKSRSDAEAIERGARLARERAKASKSRRTE